MIYTKDKIEAMIDKKYKTYGFVPLPYQKEIIINIIYGFFYNIFNLYFDKFTDEEIDIRTGEAIDSCTFKMKQHF